MDIEHDVLLTRKEAAALLRVEPNTLAVWLCRGTGPRLPVVKIHRKALYRRSDIDRLIAESVMGDGPSTRPARKRP
ncbi:MAG TPA: helix-turn-helix domain-containing protein [Phycisphaerae bacterium]|nr:helix-turn-helix domain-containing protein [Phycisphaerae bacterium]